MSVEGTMDCTQISRYQDPEIRVLSNFRSLLISFTNKKKMCNETVSQPNFVTENVLPYIQQCF